MCHRRLPHERHIPILKRVGSIKRSRYSVGLDYHDQCFLCTNRLGHHDQHVYLQQPRAIRITNPNHFVRGEYLRPAS